MSSQTLDEAIEIVARTAIANAVEDLQWEDYPDIGEYDFEKIVATAKQLAPWPDGFDAAYDLLASRAKGNDE